VADQVAARPTTLNGARSGVLMGRGGDRVAAPFHFDTRGEGIGWLGVRASGGRSEAGGGGVGIVIWRKGMSGSGPSWAVRAEKPLRPVQERNKKKIKRLAGLPENCWSKAIWAGQRK
jgi:hypothetical protein